MPPVAARPPGYNGVARPLDHRKLKSLAAAPTGPDGACAAEKDSRMQIVNYPHPALRWKSREVSRIDDALRGIVAEMCELMHAANGIGLAANQVGLPLRLFVANLSDDVEHAEDRVFINPQIVKRRGLIVGEEGCLSLPGLFADVPRAASIVVEAFDLEGRPFRAELREMPARVVQHEADHLDGILFIDRLEASVRREIEPKVAIIADEYARRQAAGEIASDEEIRARLKRLAEAEG